MKRIYIPLLMALAITSCQDNIVEPETLVHDNVMRFNLVGPDVQTKVSAGAFEDTDQIGLYVTDYVNETTPMPLQISGNRANNSLVTFDGSIWTPDQTIYWGSGKSDVYAYYPYFETVTDVNSQYFELATDQTGEGYELSDFLWAKTEGVRQTDGTVNLEMKHLMSKLTVKIIAGEDYIGSLPEDATVHLHSTVTSVNVDLENGSVIKDPYSGAKSIKMRNLGVCTFDGEKAVVYEAIVVPQMLENTVPLFEINSKSVSYLLEDSFNFRPGIAYTYTATLNASTTAIKVEIGCEIEDWNNPENGNSGEGDGSEGDDEEGEDEKVYTNLSATGTANCYLIQKSGDYKFKAVMGNTDLSVGVVKKVEVLWETFGTDEMPNVGDLIASTSYKNGYIFFSTPNNFMDGNAVIAAKSSNGVVLWTWHIWCSSEGWKEQVYYNNAGTMMDRNLGATSVIPSNLKSNGLLYQWGRMNPFLGASPTNERVASTGSWDSDYDGETALYFITNPTLFYATYYPDRYIPDGKWDTNKTMFDPCPVGWRVPDGGEKGVWVKALGCSENISNKEYWTESGTNLSGKLSDDDNVWYPNTGLIGIHFYTSGYGEIASCWTCTLNDKNKAYFFDIVSDNMNPSSISTCVGGRSVRCLKETDEVAEP